MALNILIYCDDHGTGGAAAATHRLALGLAARGYGVGYAQSPSDSPRLAERERAGVRNLTIPYDTIRYYWPSVTDARTPTRLFLDFQPDLVVFSDAMAESSLGAKEAAALLEIPYVAIKHLVVKDGLYAHNAEVGARVGRALAAAAATVTVSEQNRGVLVARYPDCAPRIVTVRNSAPDHFFTPVDPARRAAFRRRWNIPDDAFAVLTVAAAVRRKGHHHQLRMMETLKAAGMLDRFVFVWAGEEDAAYMEPLAAALAEKGCADRVRRLGYQSDVAQCLDGCDALLLSSEQEGLPLVALEGMAKGLPVVATDVGGAREILGDGGGIIVADPTLDPNGAVLGMAQALSALQADPAGRARLAAAGRAKAQAGFTGKVMLDHYDEVFRRAAFAPGDRAPPELAAVGTIWALPYARSAPADKPRFGTSPGAALNPQAGPRPRYADARFPRMPAMPATRDEALILYNAALRFPGRRAVEVGLSFGWVAWHLLAAGMAVDVADPFLSHPEVLAATCDVRGVQAGRRMRMIIGGAETLPAAIGSPADRWSLAYVDARRDVLDPAAAIDACARLAADEAQIFVQGEDVPAAAAALAALTAAGWRTRRYGTQGGLAVAWRGAVAPPDVAPDPKLASSSPSGEPS